MNRKCFECSLLCVPYSLLFERERSKAEIDLSYESRKHFSCYYILHSFSTFRPSSAPLQSILIHSSGNVKSTLFPDGWWLARFVRRRAKKMQISRCWVKRRIEWKLHWSTWESLALSEQQQFGEDQKRKQENRKSFLIHNCTLCEQLEILDMRTWRNSSRLEIIVRVEICWIFPHIRCTFIVFRSFSTCILSNRKLWLL